MDLLVYFRRMDFRLVHPLIEIPGLERMCYLKVLYNVNLPSLKEGASRFIDSGYYERISLVLSFSRISRALVSIDLL
jgi:hypothetical protein